MFTAADRDRVRDRLVHRAESDPRVAAAAIVGSLAAGDGDRWSDVDLGLGIDEAAPLEEVMAEWTALMSEEFDAVTLLDLTVQGTTYRVFLLADWLQVDLSFARASDFRQGSPRFRLLFGTHTTSFPPLPDPHDLFGWAVVHARDARASIDRRLWWRAEFAISALRDKALTLACSTRGIGTGYGKGFDELPAPVLAEFEDALVTSLAPGELRRALVAGIDLLLRHAGPAGDLAASVEHQLRALPSTG